MPNMRQVAAILVSDLHLQAVPPIARSAEPDWFAAMQRPLAEISTLSDEHECPILYAGDIFDRWNASPEVINFALRYLPHGHAIPGQHDLPNHNYEEIDRSAYGVLVRAGLLINIKPGEKLIAGGNVAVTGWPWGFKPKPNEERWGKPGALEVALIHEFTWIKGCGYPGADEAAKVNTKNLAGYDVAVYGDNHKGFLVKPEKPGQPWVINCGGMMRRKTDERDYQPGIGLLLNSGVVERYYLNTEADKFIALTEAEEAVAQTLNMGAFVEELKTLGAGDALNFKATLKRFFETNDVREDVRKVITGVIEL